MLIYNQKEIKETNTKEKEKKTMKSIYKEYYKINSEKEAIEKWKLLRQKGYSCSEIYQFNYQGNDGKFHREVFVFA